MNPKAANKSSEENSLTVSHRKGKEKPGLTGSRQSKWMISLTTHLRFPPHTRGVPDWSPSSPIAGRTLIVDMRNNAAS